MIKSSNAFLTTVSLVKSIYLAGSCQNSWRNDNKWVIGLASMAGETEFHNVQLLCLRWMSREFSCNRIGLFLLIDVDCRRFHIWCVLSICWQCFSIVMISFGLKKLWWIKPEETAEDHLWVQFWHGPTIELNGDGFLKSSTFRDTVERQIVFIAIKIFLQRMKPSK